MAVVVAVVDEGVEGGLELVGQEVVFEQDPVLQGLMPALDLALGLRMVRSGANMRDALAREPVGEIAGDVGRAVVAEQPRSVGNPPRLNGALDCAPGVSH